MIGYSEKFKIEVYRCLLTKGNGWTDQKKKFIVKFLLFIIIFLIEKRRIFYKRGIEKERECNTKAQKKSPSE